MCACSDFNQCVFWFDFVIMQKKFYSYNIREVELNIFVQLQSPRPMQKETKIEKKIKKDESNIELHIDWIQQPCFFNFQSNMWIVICIRLRKYVSLMGFTNHTERNSCLVFGPLRYFRGAARKRKEDSI